MSSSPLINTASAEGTRQTATQASAWDNQDETVDINSASAWTSPKFAGAFLLSHLHSRSFKDSQCLESVTEPRP